MTLTPAPYDPDAGAALQRVLAVLAGSPVTAWITFDVVEFTANVLMFVPLGILCVLWFGPCSRWIAPLVGLALSGAIEVTQLLFLETRVADVRDLVANTLGALLGMLVIRTRPRLRRSSRPG